MVCKAPILMHFDPSKQCHLKTDLSDYVNAGVLSQEDDNRILHPVAYFSKQMVPAKYNYKIHDKKLLAIIQCFKEWRPELEGTAIPVKVLTNHKGLKYFMTTKKLTPKQARWVEFLSEFNFKVTYQTEKKIIRPTHLLGSQTNDQSAIKTSNRSIGCECCCHQSASKFNLLRSRMSPTKKVLKPKIRIKN